MTNSKKLWFNSSIAGASSVLALLTIAGKGFGLIREIVFASNFGLSLDFDLFLIGSVVIISINTAVFYLAQHYFIPEYNLKKSVSHQEGEYFFNSSFSVFFIGGVIVSILLFLFSSDIVELFVSSKNLNVFYLTKTIFITFLVSIPLNTSISIISAYLQSNYDFTFPAVVQLIMNITIVILVFLYSKTYGIIVLPSSFLLSYLFGFVLLIYRIRKKVKFQLKDFLRIQLSLHQSKQLFSLLIIEVLSLSYTLTDRYFFEKLDLGGISALNYAMTLYALPISIISISIITVLFSKFSESAKLSRENLVIDFRKGINVSVYFMVPISIIFIFWGGDFIKIFYERGKFSSSDTTITHLALIYYSISLVFYAIYLLIVKLLYSISKYSVILYLSIVAFGLKLLLNFIFVENMEQNGLALSTSIVYIFLFLISSYICLDQLKIEDKIYYPKQFVLTLLKSALALWISFFINSLINLPDILQFLYSSFSFIVIYFANSLLLNSEDYLILKNTFFSFVKNP